MRKTVSILTTLAALPISGETVNPLSFDELAKYLKANVDTDAHKKRNADHALRDELYRDGGDAHMAAVIENVFSNKQVQDFRKKWIPYAKFNNPTKRIINEISTVYSEPAVRSLQDEVANKKYHDVLDAIRMDESAVEINRMFSLHQDIWVGFRVRVLPGDEREPVMDIATPAIVRHIYHPNDAKQIVGILVRISHRTARPLNDGWKAEWVLWTDHERALLSDKFALIPGTYVEHGFGVMPWVHVARTPSATCEGNEGADLVAAHVATWFASICMLKETKSTTKQTILSGDGTSMARDQTLDTETPVEAPDGVGVTTVDMGVDTDVFHTASEKIIGAVANAYGMSEGLLRHQGGDSAASLDLMRVPLREIRLRQQVPLRMFERLFARVMSAVLKVDHAPMAFEPDGLSIDFGESQTPLSADEMLTIFEKTRQLCLDNSVDYVRRLNPDLDDAMAKAFIERNIQIELWRNHALRPLQQISGSTGATMDSAQNSDAGLNGRAATTAQMVEPTATQTQTQTGAIQ